MVLAAVLRLARLDLTEFHIDQAGALARAEDLVRLARPPLEGARSSQGLFLEPHFSYLLAPFVAVSRDPALANAAVAAADVAAVAGTWWLGWRGFGPLAGIVAAGLYAANPGAVFYGRRLWEPDLHPALAVLLFVALELGVVGRRAWWAAVSFPIVMLGAGVHYVFLTLAPIALAPAVDLVRRRRWLPLAAGLSLAVLLTVPLFLHLRATDFQEYRDLRYRATQPSTMDLDGLRFTLRLPTGWDAPVAEVLPLADVLPGPVAQTLPLLSMVLLVGSIGLAVARLVRRDTPGRVRVRLAGLLLWLCLPAASSVRHQSDLHPHYYLMTLPAAFLLMGAGAHWLATSLGRAVVTVGVVGLGVLLALQTVAVGGLLGLVASTPEACFGAPLGVDRQTAADVLAFGGSGERVVFENDEAGDAAAIAYFVRPGFKHIVVPKPDLAGLTGPGVPLASEPLATAGPLTAAAQAVDLTPRPAVRVATAALASDPSPGWRPRLALTWQAEPTTPGPLVWQADLLDAGGAPVVSTQGQQHDPAALAGQPVVSVFSFDVPGSLPPADYRARLSLVGAPDAWLSRPIHLAPPAPCIRSVMP